MGRFHPPHNGHVFLITYAARQCQSLTIILCSLPDEQIPGAMRKQWLADLFPHAHVAHITTANPDATRDKPHATTIWAETIIQLCAKPIDSIFGSESYIYPLAKKLNAHPVLVDPERNHVPIGARTIMSSPLIYWPFLPQIVRHYFLLEIYIISKNRRAAERLALWITRRYQATYIHANSDPSSSLANTTVAENRVPIIIYSNITRTNTRVGFYHPLYLIIPPGGAITHIDDSAHMRMLPFCGMRRATRRILRTKYNL